MPSTTSALTNISARQAVALTAVVSCLLTSTAILSFQTLRREHKTEQLKKQVGEDVEEWEKSQVNSGEVSPEDYGLPPDFAAESSKAAAKGRKKREWAKGEFDEGLIREQLTRNYNFLGEESMAKVRGSYVVVVGCGGVGSWAALMLLRSGVERLRIIDFDLTTLSSLNRHACATLEDVGTPKVIATQKFLKKIAPWAQIDVQVGLWRKGDECEAWLEGADWVVDAIDNMDTKVDLLVHCRKNNIKVFASMGAGAKRDPTRVQIADISQTYEDPLARSVRRRLRVAGVPNGIPVVYSTEVPGEVKLLPLPDEEYKKGSVKELGAFDDFRVRILPVLGPLPAIFGLNIATYILHDLAGKPLTDAAEIKNRKKLYSSMEVWMSERESRVNPKETQHRLAVNAADIGYVLEDLWNGRSSLPPHPVLQKPQAVRWYRDKPVTDDNIVIMNAKEAQRHEEECLRGDKDGRELWGDEVEELVQRKAREARRVREWRRG